MKRIGFTSLVKGGSSAAAVFTSALTVQGSGMASFDPYHPYSIKPDATPHLEPQSQNSSFNIVNLTTVGLLSPLLVGARALTIPNAQFELREESEAVLGKSAVARIKSFQELPAGWRFGEGRSAQRGSLLTMESFLKEKGALLADLYGHPRVFLNEDGLVEILWRDLSGSSEIFLRFGNREIDYLISPDGDEGTASIHSIGGILEPRLAVATA